jgi:hypothetical protein
MGVQLPQSRTPPSTSEWTESIIAEVTRFLEAASARIVDLQARKVMPDFYFRKSPDKESE